MPWVCGLGRGKLEVEMEISFGGSVRVVARDDKGQPRLVTYRYIWQIGWGLNQSRKNDGQLNRQGFEVRVTYSYAIWLLV